MSFIRLAEALTVLFLLGATGILLYQHALPIAQRCIANKDPRSPGFNAEWFNFSYAFGQPQWFCRWGDGKNRDRMADLNDRLFPLGTDIHEVYRILTQSDLPYTLMRWAAPPHTNGHTQLIFMMKYGEPRYFFGETVRAKYLFDDEYRLIGKTPTRNPEAHYGLLPPDNDQ